MRAFDDALTSRYVRSCFKRERRHGRLHASRFNDFRLAPHNDDADTQLAPMMVAPLPRGAPRYFTCL